MIISFQNRYQETLFLNHVGWFFLGTLALMVISYFYVDRIFAQYFEHIPSRLYTLTSFLTNLIDPKIHYFIWPPIFFFFRFIFKKQSTANRVLLLAIATPLANVVSEILKGVCGRIRPELFLSKGLFGFQFFAHRNAFLSFPSGHATVIGALLGAFACFYPRYSYLFLALGFSLAFTRVVLNYHYLSDIIGGIFIGIVTAQWVYRVMKQANTVFSEKPKKI